MTRCRGFTLIELLVAMAIVAVIGVMALTGLSTVITQQELAAERAERWREIQLAMRMIVQDLSQVHPRVTRDETGQVRLPSLLASPNHQYALEFSRGGWSNPTGFPRGSVLRVAYDIEDDTLVRFYWPATDRSFATPPGRQELLDGVLELEVVYIAADGTLSLDWPPQTGAAANLPPTERPRAVEVTIELDDLGRVWRRIEVSS